MLKKYFSTRFLFVIILSVLMLIFITNVVMADSPPNIVTDIPWDEDPGTGGNQQTYTSVAAIEAAFNNARRQEETQLTLAANSLGNLDLPLQAVWDAMSDGKKALFIINAERVARAGMVAGVIGLPLTDTEQNMTNTAQSYADYLRENNLWGHNENHPICGGVMPCSPSLRIDNTPVVGQCHEFMARSENLAEFRSNPNPILLPIERSIYGWLYEDAGSLWGHREAVFLQDKDLDGNDWGYNNNYGSAADEGFLGIGRSSGPYNGWPQGELVVMNIFDPIPGAGCNFDQAPLAAVTDLAATRTGTTVNLNWSGNGDSYEIHRSTNTPYFIPGPGTKITEIPGIAHSLVGNLGNPNENFTYVVIAKRGAETAAPSNRVGEFDFAIISDVSPIFTYDDEPAGGLALNGTTTCGGNDIVRTFTAGAFTVNDLNVGINLNHEWRGDVRVTLQSPGGTIKQLVTEDINDSTDNYDILLDGDAGGAINDGSDDDTAVPYFDRIVMQALLDDFNGQAAAGTWTLRICDTYPSDDDGTYNRSRLVFNSN